MMDCFAAGTTAVLSAVDLRPKRVGSWSKTNFCTHSLNNALVSTKDNSHSNRHFWPLTQTLALAAEWCPESVSWLAPTRSIGRVRAASSVTSRKGQPALESHHVTIVISETTRLLPAAECYRAAKDSNNLPASYHRQKRERSGKVQEDSQFGVSNDWVHSLILNP